MSLLAKLSGLLFLGIVPFIIFAQEQETARQNNDQAVIPLNSDDPCLDPWSLLRDTTNDPKREPGPFHAGRLWNPGVLTFFQLPVALTPEDLKAGNVDVVIIGAPIDTSIGMRGAASGPTSLRAGIGVVADGERPHMHVGVAWKQELIAVDYGNAPIDFLSVERSMPPVRKLVKEIAGTGAIPVIIGGDRSLEYPNVAGVADVYGKGNVDVIHFDAHYDASDTLGGHLISYGQPIRRLCTENNLVGFDLVELNPLADPSIYKTTLYANRIVQECLTGIAMRKKGITDGEYPNPLISDDNR